MLVSQATMQLLMVVVVVVVVMLLLCAVNDKFTHTDDERINFHQKGAKIDSPHYYYIWKRSFFGDLVN